MADIDERDQKEQTELAQEQDAALDWDGGGAESSLGSHGDEDEPWEEEEQTEESKEEQAEEAVETEESEEPVVPTEDEQESIEADEPGGDTYTLDGKKYTAEEIAADPKLLSKMATHYNQVGNFQKLLDEERANISQRDEAITQLEAEKQKIEREWITRKMDEEAKRRAAEQAETNQPAPRPANKVLQTQLEPYINKLKEDGRLTDDELDEHKGLIAEYVFDQVNMQTLINNVAGALVKRVEQIEQFVNPAIQSWDQEKAMREDKNVQAAAAKLDGYEELSKPENWEKLKQYVSEKVLSSPKDADGNPTFDPIFDPETMAAQWDALQGPVARKALAELKRRAAENKDKTAKRAGGSASAGGKKPKRKPVNKQAPTEADAALDWGDGRYAG